MTLGRLPKFSSFSRLNLFSCRMLKLYSAASFDITNLNFGSCMGDDICSKSSIAWTIGDLVCADGFGIGIFVGVGGSGTSVVHDGE